MTLCAVAAADHSVRITATTPVCTMAITHTTATGRARRITIMVPITATTPPCRATTATARTTTRETRK
jgi:hypothetical protein